MSLSRYPAAPAWMASPTRAWVSSTVSITTRALGTVRLIVLGGADASQHGHADVHEDDIGLDLLGEVHRLLAVAGLGHDLELGVQRQRGLDAVPRQRMVICHEDANNVPHTAPRRTICSSRSYRFRRAK